MNVGFACVDGIIAVVAFSQVCLSDFVVPFLYLVSFDRRVTCNMGCMKREMCFRIVFG